MGQEHTQAEGKQKWQRRERANDTQTEREKHSRQRTEGRKESVGGEVWPSYAWGSGQLCLRSVGSRADGQGVFQAM